MLSPRIHAFSAVPVSPLSLAGSACGATSPPHDASLCRNGTTVSRADPRIAAICFHLGAELATRNVKDFNGVGISDLWLLTRSDRDVREPAVKLRYGDARKVPLHGLPWLPFGKVKCDAKGFGYGHCSLYN